MRIEVEMYSIKFKLFFANNILLNWINAALHFKYETIEIFFADSLYSFSGEDASIYCPLNKHILWYRGKSYYLCYMRRFIISQELII